LLADFECIWLTIAVMKSIQLTFFSSSSLSLSFFCSRHCILSAKNNCWEKQAIIRYCSVMWLILNVPCKWMLLLQQNSSIKNLNEFLRTSSDVLATHSDCAFSSFRSLWKKLWLGKWQYFNHRLKYLRADFCCVVREGCCVESLQVKFSHFRNQLGLWKYTKYHLFLFPYNWTFPVLYLWFKRSRVVAAHVLAITHCKQKVNIFLNVSFCFIKNNMNLKPRVLFYGHKNTKKIKTVSADNSGFFLSRHDQVKVKVSNLICYSRLAMSAFFALHSRS